jgi:hypothetical protein
MMAAGNRLRVGERGPEAVKRGGRTVGVRFVVTRSTGIEMGVVTEIVSERGWDRLSEEVGWRCRYARDIARW